MEFRSHKLKIKKPCPKKDLTIIYKESKNNLHEIKICKDSIFGSLRYFQKKSNEITQTSLIYIEEDIPFDLFQSFISSTETNEIEINDLNYQQFYYLSTKYEYEELRQEIEDFINTRPDVQSVLNEFIDKKYEIEIEKEELISKNLDIGIKTGLLNRLPIEIIIRILNSPKRNIKDHHLLFAFVISLIKKFSKNNENFENLSFLPSSLDYCEMSNDEIEELFSVVDESLDFGPKNADKKIQSFIVDEKKMKNDISELLKRIEQNEEKFTKKIESLEQELEKSKKDADQKIESLIVDEKKMKNDISEHEKRITQNEEKFTKKIESLEQELEKSKKDADQKVESLIVDKKKMKNNISELEKRITQNEEKFTKKIESLEQELEKSKKYHDGVIKELIENRVEKNHNELKEEINKLKEKTDEIKKQNEEIETFVPKNDDDFEGIINYLTNKTGGNIHDNGTIEVTSNSILNSDRHPKYLLNNDSNQYSTIRGDKVAWVCFDFKNIEIEITYYRIKKGPSCNIKNWIFEISNDCNTWKTIDQHTNCDGLEKKQSVKTFKVQKNNFARFCRIRHNGEFCNYDASNAMQIKQIEFYGKLKKHI